MKAQAQGLEALARIVVEDAEAACRRDEDRALNESRRLVRDEEDRIAALRRAAHALGRTRGEAAEQAAAGAAAREIAAVHAGALDALAERFEQRLLLRLRALPEVSRYVTALGHWARVAAGVLEGPAEIFCARRDRAAVYAALLGAGAEDFHVRVDHGVHVGFVVRDLDGRTVHDARPEALIAGQRDALRALLERHAPAWSPAGVPRSPAVPS